jgi:hypothetical protein
LSAETRADRWYDRLSDSERARLFPAGQKDIDAFLSRIEKRQRLDGIPAKCEDPETLLHVARLVASYNP